MYYIEEVRCIVTMSLFICLRFIVLRLSVNILIQTLMGDTPTTL